MEKRELTQVEAQELQVQYLYMTEDLQRYRRLFREKRFWEASQKDQETAMNQYEFFKKSLGSTLESLMTTPWLDNRLAFHAICNRFVSCKTKWHIVKYLIKKRMP